MDRPDQRCAQRNQLASSALNPKGQEKFFSEKEQRKGRQAVRKETGEMVRPGTKSKGRVVNRVTEPLDRSIEIRSGRINEEEMVEAFRYQLPTANQRIAQNQGGVVPDKTVAHSGGIADEDGNEEN